MQTDLMLKLNFDVTILTFKFVSLRLLLVIIGIHSRLNAHLFHKSFPL